MTIQLACPACKSALIQIDSDQVRCPNAPSCATRGAIFQRINGIWRFILPERADQLGAFTHDYEAIRGAEGRGSDDPAYYHALPFEDMSGRFRKDWQIRACSYQALVDHIVKPLAETECDPLRVLDLGAGNGWLSNRLSQSGCLVAAVDLVDNARDGLGAHFHYENKFLPVQAEFDYLPFLEGQFNLAIYNASLHYTCNYEQSLIEALRTLKVGGTLVIMDTPTYKNGESGNQMVREREARFQNTYGTASNSLGSENFLTLERISDLAGYLDLKWKNVRPRFGWRWSLERKIAGLRAGREPAHFPIIWAEKTAM